MVLRPGLAAGLPLSWSLNRRATSDWTIQSILRVLRVVKNIFKNFSKDALPKIMYRMVTYAFCSRKRVVRQAALTEAP